MPANGLWLTLLLEQDAPKWPPDLNGCRISLDAADTLQQCDYPYRFRASPIFPLTADYIRPDLKRCDIYFYTFDQAFLALGRIQNFGSPELRRRTWYSIGLASIVLMAEKPDLDMTLVKIVGCSPRALEKWSIGETKIREISCKINAHADYDRDQLKVHDYKTLPLTPKAVVDEFVASIALIVPKIVLHMPYVLEVFVRLVEQVNELVDELVYLHGLQGRPPETLCDYSEAILTSDALVRETIIHQDVDRLIQINAALSYVTTQAVTGATPILERRSLIRRHSLLGIGTAIMALNNLARSIEQAFSKHPLEDILADKMAEAGPLPGLEDLPAYDPSEWKTHHSVDRWAHQVKERKGYPKLPYYSGRLGFREAEHAISAAVQALSGGASVEWSLLTVTHEILHGHVRNLLALIFRGRNDRLPEEKRRQFYERFEDHLDKKPLPKMTQLESLRNIILAYCCRTVSGGSLTRLPNRTRSPGTECGDCQIREMSHDFWLPDCDSLWRLLEDESRNISEIWVHVLDLHYFYGSHLHAHIPLIWQSWTEVPHVKGDLRQYILRSLLTIATKVVGTEYGRFKACVGRLEEMLQAQVEKDGGAPLIQSVLNYVRDEKRKEDLFYPFSASLILVDSANNILVSQSIRSILLDDPHVNWVSDASSFEDQFEYRLPEGIVEETVEKPAAYLLDRMIRRLRGSKSEYECEAETARLFLACGSCSKGA